MDMRTSVALALASSIATPAFAGGHHHEETPEEKALDADVLAADAAPHAQYGIGARVGSFHVGSIYDIAYGFALEGGVRMGRLQVLGDYTLMGLSPVTPPQSATTTAAALGDVPAAPMTDKLGGMVQRFGLLARYSPARFIEANGGVGVRGDIFVEGGVGEQLIDWSGGGYLHRSDIELGAGISIQFRGPHHHGGYFIGVKVAMASPPSGAEMATAATCAGPCDGPSKPIGIDRAVLGMFTAIFGD
jgi:hypothetical protein